MHGGRHLTIAVALTLWVSAAAACGGGGSDEADSGSPSAATGAAVPEVRFESALEEGVPEGHEEPKPAPLTIGMSSALRATETVRTMETAARLETERLGGRFIAMDAEGSPDKQVSDLEVLINRKVDAIVVTPLDVAALRPIGRKAREAGIPIFGQDMNVKGTTPGSGFTGQVSQRRDFTAYLQAREAASRMQPGAGYGQIGFIIKVPTFELGYERVRYWGDKFGIKMLGRADNRSDDIAGGQQAMTDLLGPHRDLEGVIAYNEEAATGAAAAARSAGKRDIPIVGAGGTTTGISSIRSGRIDATVQVQAPDVGRQLVWGAYNAVAGKEVPPTVLTGPPVLITQENVDTVPSWPQILEKRYGKAK